VQIKVYTWKYTGPLSHWGHAALRVRADPDEYKRLRQRKKEAEAELKTMEYELAGSGAVALAQLSPLYDTIDGYAKQLEEKRTTDRDVYVSWWPDGPIGSPLSDVKAKRIHRYHDDKRAKERSADFKRELPAVEDGNVFGLSAKGIIDWWPGFLARQKTYAPTSMNCSTVVALALSAGGAEDYVPKPSPTGWWEPQSVQSWVEQLETHLHACNTMVRQLEQQLKLSMPQMPGAADSKAAKVMSLEEWKKATDPGFFARRLEHWTLVDKSLTLYHHFANIGKTDRARAALQSIVKELKVIIGKVPDSKRMDPVKNLYIAARTQLEALAQSA
jgi:hypothetical protein